MSKKSRNKCEFIGNLTRDPELRYTSGGTAIVDVGIALNESYQKNGEWQDSVTYINCTGWDKTAERIAAQYKKGDRIYVETKFKLDTWEDKNSSEKRSAPKFTIFEHWPLAKDVKMNESAPQEPEEGYSAGDDPDEDEDIPF